MAIVSDIEIRLRADIAQLRNDLRRAQGEISGSINTIRKSLLTLAAGFSVAQIVNEVIRAQREFDKLNSSLITATGSTKAAGEAMKALQDFAARTPFSLQEVTEGFLKLRNLGLTPSERALESYGNTSAAMGKSLMQLVEAVADATTGEFERLKEFGIKAKQQGDQVSLTFQGTTTKIGNNAAEIEEYLTRIGEVNFAGGMSRQADTLDGDLSRLGDTWSQTLVAFSQSGFGDVVRGSVGALSEALADLGAMFKAVRGAADEEGKKIDEIAPLHDFLTTVFEALTVLGVNIAHIFKTIGGDIGALGAAATLALQGEFKAAADLVKQRIKDGEAELAAVEATSAAILGAAAKRKQAEKEANKQTEDRLEQYKIIGDETKTLSDAEIKAAAKAAEAYKLLLRTLNDRVDATAREAAGLEALSEAEKAHLDLTRQIADGKLKLSKTQETTARSLIDEARANEVLARSNKEFNDLQQQLIDNAADLARTRQQAIASAREEAEQNEFLVQTFGMAEEAIMRLQAARLLEQEAQRLGRDLTQEEIKDLKKVIELKERSAKAVANKRELEEAKQFWTDIDKTARDTFVSITDGGKNAFQRLKDTAKNTFFDWLYQQTLKKWIINIQANSGGTGGILQALGGSSSSSSGGGMGNISNLLSIGKTIYSGFSTGLAGSLGSTISSLGSMFGSQAVSGFGAGLTGSSLGASTALGSSGYAGTAAAGAGASAGAYAIPIAGWIAAGMTVANNLYKQGWDATNGTLNTVGKLFGSSILGFNSVLKKIGLSNSAANIFSGQATLSKLFGRKNPEIESQGIQGTIGAVGFSGQNFANILQKGGVFRSDKRSVQAQAFSGEQDASFDKIITSMVASVKGFGAALGLSTTVIDGYQKQIKLTLTKDEAENEKLIAELFAGVGDELAMALLPTIAKFQAEGETAAMALERVAGNFSAVTEIMRMTGVNAEKAFNAVGVASLEARERLISLAGGIEALASQTEFFTSNFLTEAEQINLIQGPLNKQLADLGYAGITTTEQFKEAVQGLVASGRLATEEGAKVYAGLLAAAPQFKIVADYLKELGDSAAETARQAEENETTRLAGIANQRRQLEIQIMELSGDSVGALAATRADELAAVDATLHPLYQHIYALQDQKAAAEAATAALEQNEQTLRGYVDSALAGVQRAVQADRDAATAGYQASMAQFAASISGVNNRISEMSSLATALGSAIGAVESDAQQDASRAAARAQVQAAIVIAKASGVLPTADSLKDALSTLNRDASDQFSSLADYQREVARTNAELETLSGMTSKQLSDAQMQLRALESQRSLTEQAYQDEMQRLDKILEKAQEQVDAVNGVNNTTMSLLAALATLSVTIQGLKQGATPSNPSGGNLTVEELYRTVLGREGEKAGIEFWKKAFGDIVDPDEYAMFIKGAMPELEMLERQRRQNEAAANASGYGTMSSSSASSPQDMTQMNARLDRIAAATEQFASQFNQVSAGGNALLTEPA